MKTITDFPRKITVTEDLRIPMPDGVELSARLWLPEDANENPVPTILEHLPYRKRDGTIARDELTHPYFAGHGYACLRIDMRGNGDSEGLMQDEYESQEWEDAIAAMAWVADQPWSTGDWGMMGISWGGFNALQLAALRPKGLKAVISLCSTTDRYADDIHFKGGAMLGENLGWAAQMLAYSSRPPDPLIVGENWRDIWLNRLSEQPFLLETWLQHQTRDTYWQHGSVCEDYAAIDIPVLAIGGWHDGYRNTPAALVRNLDTAKAIVGPWNHKYPHFAAPGPQIGFCQEALRWWDRWLKGIPTGIENEPRERLYVMDSVAPNRHLTFRPGRWAALNSNLPEERWHLSETGLSKTEGSLNRPLKSPQTCGSTGGEYFPFAFGPEHPSDQATDDVLSATFDTPRNPSNIEIIGAPKVKITLVPNGTQGHLILRLTDLRPDGTSALISHGMLNLAHHKSHATPEALIPNQPITVNITLDQCAYSLPEGHRLRLAISTACWPFLWPDAENAGVVLTSGTLDLPTQPAQQENETSFPPPEAATPWRATELRTSKMTRGTKTNPDGSETLTITIDNGETRDDHHLLATGSRSTETWTIHPSDPLSAKAIITWESTMSRADWAVTTKCTASLTADKSHWYPKATLEAIENGERVFEKSFETSIPRNCL